jgi:hypothetical protein
VRLPIFGTKTGAYAVSLRSLIIKPAVIAIALPLLLYSRAVAQNCMESGTYDCDPADHSFPGSCYSFLGTSANIQSEAPEVLWLTFQMGFMQETVGSVKLEGYVDCENGSFNFPANPNVPVISWSYLGNSYTLYILSFSGTLLAFNHWQGTIAARVEEDVQYFPICGTQTDAWIIDGTQPVAEAPPAASGPGGLRPPMNPFWPGSEITFDLLAATECRLSVISVAGREVAVIAARPFGPGTHRARWDGRLTDGTPAPGGLYFIRLSGPPHPQPRKIILVRSARP